MNKKQFDKLSRIFDKEKRINLKLKEISLAFELLKSH